MFHDLHTHFVEDLVLQYNEYNQLRKTREKSHNSLLRKSLSLATSLYHFNEHLPKENQHRKKMMYRECPDYEILRDVVNLSKHREITYYTPIVAAATDIYECLVIAEFEDEEGPFGDGFKAVFVKLVDGNERDLHDVIVNVMNFWITKLLQMEVLEKFSLIPQPTVKVPTRIEADEDFDLGAIQGLPYDLKIKIMKYNYSSGKLEPYPKKIKKAEFNSYEKRTYSFTFTLDDNRKIEFDLDLYPEEESLFKKFSSDHDMMQYAMHLAHEKNVIPKLEGKDIVIHPKEKE